MGGALRSGAAALVCAAAAFVAYVFGAGYVSDRGVGLPTPLNAVGALAVLWAAAHLAYVLVTRRRPSLPRVAVGATTLGAVVAVATIVAALVPR